MAIDESLLLSGNLLSYKVYTKPMIEKICGGLQNPEKLSSHQKNIRRILRVLAINGQQSTWSIAKILYRMEKFSVREKEKEIRRIISGRVDRCKRTPGILNLGIIEKITRDYGHITNEYRLTLSGILFVIDGLELTDDEIDKMVQKHQDSLPLVFGIWDELKRELGKDVYNIRLISSGLLLDNIQTELFTRGPMYELMNFLNIKYHKNFEHLTGHEFSEQISYWFYTSLMMSSTDTKRNNSLEKKFKKIFFNHPQLEKWYLNFIDEAKKYYKKRLYNLDEFKII